MSDGPLVGEHVSAARAFAEMRRITDLTGQVFDAQVKTLKVVCHLLMESVVTIKLDTMERIIEVSGEKQPPEGAVAKLEQAVASILTPRWKLRVCYDSGSGPQKPTSRTHGKRIRRLQKVRRKR